MSNFVSDVPNAFSVPTYAWRIPRVAGEFIMNSSFSGSKKAYFVMTCGSETGDAAFELQKICGVKGFEFMGLASVIIPDNYLAMFPVPAESEAKEIIKKALPKLKGTVLLIRDNKPLPAVKTPLSGKFMSGIVNPVFYKLVVSSKGFT